MKNKYNKGYDNDFPATTPERLKKELKNNGLALDIDETLSFTLSHWFSELRRLFGNPEKMTVKQIIKKYRYFQNVPYWQTDKAKAWADEARYSNDLQVELPLIENSNRLVQKVNKVKPIVVYLTTRPEIVTEGTARWLKKHGFPSSPIIARPTKIPHEKGNGWKAKTLNYLYPEVEGIIDDQPALVEKLPGSYKGTVYLYDSKDSPRSDLKVIPCKSWSDVLKEVKLN